MTTEVCQCCSAAATPEGQHSHLVLDSVLNQIKSNLIVSVACIARLHSLDD